MAILGRRIDPADAAAVARRPADLRDVPPRPDGPDRGAAANVVTGRTGRAWDTAGEASRNAVLTAQDVMAIRAANYAEVTRAELAQRYGVQPKRITEIRTGRAWRDHR